MMTGSAWRSLSVRIRLPSPSAVRVHRAEHRRLAIYKRPHLRCDTLSRDMRGHLRCRPAQRRVRNPGSNSCKERQAFLLIFYRLLPMNQTASGTGQDRECDLRVRFSHVSLRPRRHRSIDRTNLRQDGEELPQDPFATGLNIQLACFLIGRCLKRPSTWGRKDAAIARRTEEGARQHRKHANRPMIVRSEYR
jgi:hypothetical protein